MIELRRNPELPRTDGATAATPADASLRLPFELRQKSRLRTRLTSGEEVALLLPRGEVLRGGDRLRASDGRVIEVVAEPEPLVHITCAGPRELARAAYHLGNRHVAVQLGDGFLRIAADHVLEELVRRLGARTHAVEEAFEPEAGAYGGGHHHGEAGPGGDPRGGARIHSYGEADGEVGHRGHHEHEHSHHDHSHHEHEHEHEHGHHEHGHHEHGHHEHEHDGDGHDGHAPIRRSSSS